MPAKEIGIYDNIIVGIKPLLLKVDDGALEKASDICESGNTFASLTSSAKFRFGTSTYTRVEDIEICHERHQIMPQNADLN